MSCTQC